MTQILSLTKKRADILKRMRLRRGFTVDQVVAGTDLDKRTYLRWEGRKVRHMREQNLQLILPRLRLTWEELLAERIASGPRPELLIDPKATTDGTASTVIDLMAMTEQMDKTVMAIMQSERASLLSREAYKDLLYGGLLRRGLSLDAFTAAIEGISQKGCLPGVTLELNEALDRLDISIGREPVLTIFKPSLLWECSCLPGELESYLRARGHKPHACRICTHPRGQELMNLTSREFVELRHKGVNIMWRQSPQISPPSIDSVLMLNALESTRAWDAPVDSILDLGCGTGVLAICMAKLNKSVRRIGLADWLLTPLLHAALNAKRNLEESSVRWALHLGMFDDWISSSAAEPYDVVLCAPPYLPPADGFASVRAQSPVAGTELVEFLIQTRMAKTAYIALSSLVDKETKRLAKRHNVSIVPVSAPIEVPFRVPAALRSVSYIDALVKSKRLALFTQRRYPLWHRITTFKLTAT